MCNRFRIRPVPKHKHMKAQGFVSKNDRREKADRKTTRPIGHLNRYYGTVIGQSWRRKPLDPHSFVTLPLAEAGYISLPARFRHVSASACLEENR
jgi:hypothetical protein